MFQNLALWFSQDILHLAPQSPASNAATFFIADSLVIILLLVFITHFMSLLRFYLPTQRIRNFLRSHQLFGLDYFFAAFFGAFTPFCSCSSIPLFIGFLEAGIPLGVTLTFLVTSPLINEAALAIFWGVFGWKVTLVYAISGITLGILSGFILGRFKLEKYVEDYVWKTKGQDPQRSKNTAAKPQLSLAVLKQVSKEARGIAKKVIPYVLAGVAVGAIIHGYVPEGFFEQYITKENPLAVPVAVILAVPLYSGASGAIPVVQSLVNKGIPLGTALAFMMAIVGLSFPEALILKKVMKLKLLIIFFITVTLGIIFTGYLFNLIF